ncbi:trigger factor-related chaperone [Mycoplasmopsis alligatoris]|uniref:Trigger factor C-terminal domain-containing protein n=1 Tax=Mycoplasmopsis alligatoris A21JP2 TaxID=747682 RepID=D4XWJ1_9BACT|nr:hypothetical protein [Mycoplasmopsis alligatoris]EFF41109.1 hypothetical protein MALL_0439 [Mycoplasmopsis alligatoris A21JP2]
MKIIEVEKEFSIQGEDWIKLQKQTLDYLQAIKEEKIDQEKILSYALNRFINENSNNFLQTNLVKHDRFFRDPIVISATKNIESANAKLMFFEYTEYDKKMFDENVNVEFKLNGDYNAVKTFAKTIMTAYNFRISQDKIDEQTNSLSVEILDLKTNEKDQRLVKKENELFNILIKKTNSAKGDSFQDEKHKITILDIYKYKVEPITQSNLHLLNIDELKNLDQVEAYIEKIAGEQFYNIALNDYKNQIYQHFMKKLNTPDLRVSEALVRSLEYTQRELLKNYYKGKKQEVDKETFNQQVQFFVNSSIFSYFIDQYFFKKFYKEITKEAIEKEIYIVKQLMPMEQKEEIDEGKIYKILIDRKVSLHFLKMNNKEQYEKYLNIVK